MHMLRTVSAIKAGRNALGWSQADLATRAGIAKVTLARIEACAITPRLSSLMALQKALQDAGVVIQDNLPFEGYTLTINPSAITTFSDLHISPPIEPSS